MKTQLGPSLNGSRKNLEPNLHPLTAAELCALKFVYENHDARSPSDLDEMASSLSGQVVALQVAAGAVRRDPGAWGKFKAQSHR